MLKQTLLYRKPIFFATLYPNRLTVTQEADIRNALVKATKENASVQIKFMRGELVTVKDENARLLGVIQRQNT